jgi:hypothetical protein
MMGLKLLESSTLKMDTRKFLSKAEELLSEYRQSEILNFWEEAIQ